MSKKTTSPRLALWAGIEGKFSRTKAKSAHAEPSVPKRMPRLTSDLSTGPGLARAGLVRAGLVVKDAERTRVGVGWRLCEVTVEQPTARAAVQRRRRNRGHPIVSTLYHLIRLTPTFLLLRNYVVNS